MPSFVVGEVSVAGLVSVQGYDGSIYRPLNVDSGSRLLTNPIPDPYQVAHTAGGGGGVLIGTVTKAVLNSDQTRKKVLLANITPPASAFTANLTSGSPTVTITALTSGTIGAGQTVTGTGIPASTLLSQNSAGVWQLVDLTGAVVNATATNTGVAVTGVGSTPTVVFGSTAYAAIGIPLVFGQANQPWTELWTGAISAICSWGTAAIGYIEL